LRLTREQRVEIFAGNYPRIAFPGDRPCPVGPGDVHRLSAKVSIAVLGVRRHRKTGEHILQYAVRDDRPRLLRSGVRDFDFDAIRRSYDEHGMPAEPDAEVIERARVEGAYTTSPRAALPGEPEAVDDDTLRRHTADAQERFAEHRQSRIAELRRRHADLPPEARLAELRQLAREQGIEVRSEIKAIERRLDAITRRLENPG
jgi:hypothetical protein